MNREVLTFLPLDYHANLAWEIDTSLCDKARDVYYQKNIQEQPKKFLVYLHVGSAGYKTGRKLLFKEDAWKYRYDIARFLEDEELKNRVRALLSGMKVLRPIVTVKAGSKCVPFKFDI